MTSHKPNHAIEVLAFCKLTLQRDQLSQSTCPLLPKLSSERLVLTINYAISCSSQQHNRRQRKKKWTRNPVFCLKNRNLVRASCTSPMMRCYATTETQRRDVALSRLGREEWKLQFLPENVEYLARQSIMCLNRLGSGLCEAVHNRRSWTSPRWGRRIDSSSHGLKKWAELELPISEGLGFRTRCSRAPRSSGIRLDKEKRSRVGLYNSLEKKKKKKNGNGSARGGTSLLVTKHRVKLARKD